MDHLSHIEHAPSVQFQARPPGTEAPKEVYFFFNQIYCHSFYICDIRRSDNYKLIQCRKMRIWKIGHNPNFGVVSIMILTTLRTTKSLNLKM